MSKKGLFKHLWGIILGLLSILLQKMLKNIRFLNYPKIGIKNIILRLEKSTEMNHGSYFCFLLLLYDSLYSNELFLLVNLNFQG